MIFFSQIMSLFATIPPLVAVYKLLRRDWEDFLDFLWKLPGKPFRDGLRFLIKGTPLANPWLNHDKKKIPETSISFPKISERYWLGGK
jgi:hypothetical protein